MRAQDGQRLRGIIALRGQRQRQHALGAGSVDDAQVRGRQLMAVQMVARITRDGSRGTPEERALGKEAASRARMLQRRWKDEDAKACRMKWTDYL